MHLRLPIPKFNITSKAVALVLACISQGCFSTTLVNRSLTPSSEKHEEWNSFFFWGLAGEADIRVSEICRHGQAWKVEDGTNGATWILNLITLGIYSPRKVDITCAEPSRASAMVPSSPASRSEQ